MAYYLFNFEPGDAARARTPRDLAADSLRVAMWGVGADEPHRDALAPGDVALIYLGAPDRVLVGRAEVATAVHDWTPPEARSFPGDSPAGVLLARVEEWDPPVPMETVLSQIDPSESAKADFDVGVVRITDTEYATAVAVAAQR